MIKRMIKFKNHSVIILNYNDWNECVSLIGKIILYENITNIVLVDNCSTDDSYINLKEEYKNEKKVYLIKTEKNGGYAYGNAYGCAFAINELNAEYITVANPDVVFEESVLDKVFDVFKVHEDAAIVGCKMKCFSGIDLPSAWKIPKYGDCILENLLILRKLVGDKKRYNLRSLKGGTIKVDVIAGSLFTVKSKVYNMIKGFDINTFLYYEENILAHKIKTIGYQNYLCLDATYDHMHSVSINKSFKTRGLRLDLAFNSRKYYVEKYLKCNKVEMILLCVTYHIGKINYLVIKELQDRFKGDKA